jgi:mono/diheme cytochrome c family protein
MPRVPDSFLSLNFGALVAAGVLAALFLQPKPGNAQDGAAANPTPAPASEEAVNALVAQGLDVWLNQGGCFNCHGTYGEGGEGGHFPAGPSLRRSGLDRDGIWITVACGRPGSEMPYNIMGAYTVTSCYGQPVPGDPAALGVPAGTALTIDEIDAVVALIMAEMVGKATVTRDACALFHDGNRDHEDCAWR